MSGTSFRDIRPSFGESSKKRRGLLDLGSERDSSPETRRAPIEGIVKHRKVPDSITRNACLNCRRARSKCDGRTPCKRCASRAEGHECVYEIHVKHAKEDLVRQIKQLQKKDMLSQQIFQALAADISVPEILDSLQNGESQESIANWLDQAVLDQDQAESISPVQSNNSGFEINDHPMNGTDSGPSSWTSVTNNPAILDHLFQLYFAWVHPVHTLFHEGQFVNSYHNRYELGEMYCSSVLVNALCAMACHLHTRTEGDITDYVLLGNGFAAQVRKDIDYEDYRITTVQAFAAMFLVELARGNGLRAASYLKVAISCLPQVPYEESEAAREVWRSTVLGIQSLNVEWTQITFQVPWKIDLTLFSDTDEACNEVDKIRWHFYSKEEGGVPSWPGLQATTSREKSKLISIIQDINIALYSNFDPQLSALQILDLYHRLVNWREDLPDSIINLEAHNHGHALPHVLSLLILYSNSVVQLLRPLLTLDGFPSHLIEDIIWSHAQQGFSLLGDTYRDQFTCRFQSVMQMYSLLHFTEVIARYFPGGAGGRTKDGPQAVVTGISILEESVASFPVASIMQEMLRRMARSCSIRIPRQLESDPPLPVKVYFLDDFLLASTRPTFVQPVEEIRLRYSPSLIADWIDQSNNYQGIERRRRGSSPVTSSSVGSGAQDLMKIRHLLNTGSD